MVFARNTPVQRDQVFQKVFIDMSKAKVWIYRIFHIDSSHKSPSIQILQQQVRGSGLGGISLRWQYKHNGSKFYKTCLNTPLCFLDPNLLEEKKDGYLTPKNCYFCENRYIVKTPCVVELSSCELYFPLSGNVEHIEWHFVNNSLPKAPLI